MNRSTIVRLLSIGLLLMATLTACTKKFDELNTPKNAIAVDKIDGSLIGQAFAQAQWGTVAGQYQVGQNLYADIYSQYFATTHINFNSDQFLETGAWTNIWFNYYYSSPGTQLNFVDKYTAENDLPLANAVVKVWKVIFYHRISDYFGPVIYNEFGKGQTSVLYDSQETIYKDFFRLLDEAVAVFKANPGTNAFANNDQVYNGDIDKWLVLANSLRLRMAIRLSYIEPELAKAEAEKAMLDGVMVSNTSNAGVLSTANSINNLSTWTYIDEFRMSATMNSILVGFNDPRLDAFFNQAGGRLGGNLGWHGVRNGLPAGQKGGSLNNDHSFVDTKWLPIANGGANLRSALMNAAEVYFLRAEGAMRGWNMQGTAEELYNEGIRMSLTQWTTTAPSAIEDYIASPAQPVALADRWNSPAVSTIPVKFEAAGSFERQLEQVITQKWISMFPDGREAWAERRRTGYPTGYAVINTLNPDVPTTALMRRLAFTTGEISTNKVAVDAARTLIGGPDANYTRLWWDAKPLGLYPTPVN